MNFYDVFMIPFEKKILSSLRKKIIPMASGHILEIGYGTGVNFNYYKPALIKSLTALESHSINSPVTTKVEFPISFLQGRAEHLPFPDESLDTIVETLVFCSVEDLYKAIEEVHRVLKPGGLFIFIDHVKPENKALAKVFKGANPLWNKISGGCHLTREPHKLILETGFTFLQSNNQSSEIFQWGVAEKPMI